MDRYDDLDNYNICVCTEGLETCFCALDRKKKQQ